MDRYEPPPAYPSAPVSMSVNYQVDARHQPSQPPDFIPNSNSDLARQDFAPSSTNQRVSPLSPDQGNPLGVVSPPILIPQCSIPSILKPPPPFMRAYPPVLMSSDISSGLFLSILDTLNICVTPPAPLQALNVVGQGIGYVPHHWAQGASFGITAVAGASTAAIRHAKIKEFLESVNRDVFHPRGLEMEIMKDENVMRMLRWNPASPVPSERLRELSHIIAELSFDLDPPEQRSNILDRIAISQATSRLNKDQKKADQKRIRREEQYHNATMSHGRPNNHSYEDYDSDVDEDVEIRGKLQRLDEKIARINQKADAELEREKPKKAEKIEKKRSKDLMDVEKDRTRLHQKQAKAAAKAHDKQQEQGEKEKKKVAKLEWLVIRNLRSVRDESW